MCTRYYLDMQLKKIREFAERAKESKLLERFGPKGDQLSVSREVGPSDVAPVIATSRAGSATLFPMKWGFQLAGGSLLVNARSETAEQKPTFREAFASHRCIVPAAWYFEWEHFEDKTGKKRAGEKYRIRPKEEKLTYLGGLYRIENGIPVFVVLTKELTEDLQRIHDRMPLIFPENMVNEWIRPDIDPKALLPYALTNLELKPSALPLEYE